MISAERTKSVWIALATVRDSASSPCMGAGTS